MRKWLWKMTSIQTTIKTLPLIVLGLTVGALHAASLNKCTDASGMVTYSNLACTGAQQARKVEIDPAPPVPNVQKLTPEKAPAEKNSPEKTPVEKSGTVKLETFSPTPKKKTGNTGNNCDALTNKLGHVLDKMDAARNKGYTQKQMEDWKLDIKELERKKQQAGCF
jgi:hypothetical protein